MKRKSTFIKKTTISDQNSLAKFGFFKKANITKEKDEETPQPLRIKKEDDQNTKTPEVKSRSEWDSVIKQNNDEEGNLSNSISSINSEELKECTKTETDKIKEMQKCELQNINKKNVINKDYSCLPLHKQIEPKNKEEYFHEYRSQKNPLLCQLLNEDINFNLIIHGPPGSGKSALINVLKNKTNNCFVNFIHMNNFNSEIKNIHDKSLLNHKMHKKKTIFCVKDINRFNKTQQDNLLLLLKKGHVFLLATCLENPMNNLNPSLISRCMLLYLPPYQDKELELILNRGINKLNVKLSKEVIKVIIDHSSGDARVALSILDFVKKMKNTINNSNPSVNIHKTTENVDTENKDCVVNQIDSELITEKETDKINIGDNSTNEDETISIDEVMKVLQNFPSTDKKLDHYSFMSALQKSIRAGNTKAAILYLMKSLQNGEDPLYICRRLIRIASEDIGIANNDVLSICVNTHYACKTIGMPECQTSLIYAVVVLCKSSKSNYIYLISDYANKICQEHKFTVPFNLKNTSDKYVYTNQPEILSFDEHIKKYKDVQKYLPSHMEDINLPPTPQK